MTRARRLFVAAWAFAALSACGDDAGGSATDAAIEGGAPTPAVDAATADAMVSCGDFGQSDACGACIAAECCAAGAACEGSVECTMLVACARTCDADDSDCLGACVGDHPTGRAGYNTLVLCMGDRCLADCPHPTP